MIIILIYSLWLSWKYQFQVLFESKCRVEFEGTQKNACRTLSREHGYTNMEAVELIVEKFGQKPKMHIKRKLSRVPASWLYAWHRPSFKLNQSDLDPEVTVTVPYMALLLSLTPRAPSASNEQAARARTPESKITRERTSRTHFGCSIYKILFCRKGDC